MTKARSISASPASAVGISPSRTEARRRRTPRYRRRATERCPTIGTKPYLQARSTSRSNPWERKSVRAHRPRNPGSGLIPTRYAGQGRHTPGNRRPYTPTAAGVSPDVAGVRALPASGSADERVPDHADVCGHSTFTSLGAVLAPVAECDDRLAQGEPAIGQRIGRVLCLRGRRISTPAASSSRRRVASMFVGTPRSRCRSP